MAEKDTKISVQGRFDQFVEYVRMAMEEKGRKLLHVGGQWYEYEEGAWTAWTEREREAFETILYRLASSHEFPYSTQRSAIWTTLAAAFGSEEVIEFDSQPMIVCNSKTYFLDENKLKKHSPAHYATRRIFLDVDPKAKCAGWLAMLDRCFDDYSKEARTEIIQFLKEWMGVAIVGGAAVKSRRDMRKGLFLYGETRTGKSSISDVLTVLLGGEKRVIAPGLASLSTRFGLEPLIGKAAIITNEAANARTAADSDTLKCLITGDTMQADRKGLGAIPFNWNGPVLFTTNNLPKIEDDSDALYDRTVVIEFTRVFSKEDVAATLDGHANAITYLVKTNQLPGILNWCLEGYDEVQERGRILVPKAASAATDKFKRQNDKVFDFLKECCVYDPKHGCSSEAVSIACKEFALTRHDAHISVASAAKSIARLIRTAVPGVVAEQGYHDKQQFRAYSKLRLNGTGMGCMQLAETKPYPTIKQAVKRTNYRYG